MHDASGAELNAVIKAISDSFVDWNKVPETLADEEDKKEEEKKKKEERRKKNKKKIKIENKSLLS